MVGIIGLDQGKDGNIIHRSLKAAYRHEVRDEELLYKGSVNIEGESRKWSFYPQYEWKNKAKR